MSRAHVLILGEKAETGRFIREQLEGQDLDVVETGKLDQGIQQPGGEPLRFVAPETESA